MLAILWADCLFLSWRNAFQNMISVNKDNTCRKVCSFILWVNCKTYLNVYFPRIQNMEINNHHWGICFINVLTDLVVNIHRFFKVCLHTCQDRNVFITCLSNLRQTLLNLLFWLCESVVSLPDWYKSIHLLMFSIRYLSNLFWIPFSLFVFFHTLCFW